MREDSAFRDAGESGESGRAPVRLASTIASNWQLIAATVAIVVGSTLIYSATATKRYEAHTQIVVSPLPGNSIEFLGVNTLLRDSTQGDPVVTAAQLLGSPQIRASATQTAEGRGATFAVTPRSQSNVVDIAATAPTAKAAADAANAYADAALASRAREVDAEANAAMDRVRLRLATLQHTKTDPSEATIAGQLRPRLGQLASLLDSPDPTLSVLSRATPPASAVWPRTKLSLVVALLCGLLLGTALAFLRERTRRAVRDGEELRRSGLPVLARVPFVADGDLRRTMLDDPPSVAREGYRMLRGVLLSSRQPSGGPGVIAVLSVSRDEGRTGAAIGLARAFADADRRVILVDGDMRQPIASLVFGAGEGIALPDLLRSQSTPDPALTPLEPRNLRLLPSANDPDGPDLLASDNMENLLATLRAHADVVVVDAPPIDEAGDAYAFAAAADTVLVCASPGRTDREALDELLLQLDRLTIEPAGVVEVDRRAPRPGRAGDARGPRATTGGAAGASAHQVPEVPADGTAALTEARHTAG